MELPIPKIGPGAILVKVEMAGICGTDVHLQRGDLTIKPPVPILPGHETIGKIVELGEGRTRDWAGEPLKVGDRIMWAHEDCGECYFCTVVRMPVLCERRSGYGFGPPELLRGGFSEYEYIGPKTMVVKVPEELSGEEAIGVGCAFRSVMAGFERLGGVHVGERVVVQGAGPIGLYSLLLAAEGGASRVIVVGAPRKRLELAKRWGASEVVDIDEVKDPGKRKEIVLSLTEGRGPEVVVEASGVAEAINEGLEMVQKGGRYLVLGQSSFAKVQIMPSLITSKNLTIIGSISATIAHFYKALQFLKAKRGKYPLGEIVTKRYRLEEINEALDRMALGEEIKPVIDFR